MNELIDLLRSMSGNPQCQMETPVGLPETLQEHVLPEDVQLFYRLCGGLTLGDDLYDWARIVSPQEVVQSWVGVYHFTPEELDRKREHPSWAWYIVGRGETGGSEYISIDLDPARSGHCYWSFWGSHADAGFTPVIATSFSEMLERMWVTRGKSFQKGEPGFKSLGDFYELFGDIS